MKKFLTRGSPNVIETNLRFLRTAVANNNLGANGKLLSFDTSGHIIV